MNKSFLLSMLLFSVCFAYQSVTDTVVIRHKMKMNNPPIDNSPAFFLTKSDSADSAIKLTQFGSVAPDSVRAAWKADTAGVSRWSRRPIAEAASAADTGLLARRGSDSTFQVLTREQLRTAVDSVRTAHEADHADSANVALGFIHGIAVGYIPVATSFTTMNDSTLSFQPDGWLQLGKQSSTNTGMTLLQNGSSANTRSELRFINDNTEEHYYGGSFSIRLAKKSSGSDAGWNKFILRSITDNVPETFIDHIVIEDSTGQIKLNDTLYYDLSPYPNGSQLYRSSWYPVWIKHGGLKNSSGTWLDSLPVRTTIPDSIILARGDGLLQRITVNNFRTGLGLDSVFCDSPYVPYSYQSGSQKGYRKTIMKQRTNYLEIEPMDTAYAALLVPDNYYVSMTSDAAGYIYTIAYSTPRLIRMTGAIGVYDEFTIKSRTWNIIHCDKNDNTLYAGATYSAGNQGLYLWNQDSLDFVFYDSVYYGNSSITGITATESGDLFACFFDGYIYRQVGKTGDFTAYSDRRYWTSLCARGDTVFAFTNNAGVFMKTPAGTSFAIYDGTVRGYGQSWDDSSGNLYALQSSSPSGIYRRAFGTTTFELYHSYGLSNVQGGTYSGGNNYISVSLPNGDVYRYDAYYSTRINRLTVNGSATFNGIITANVEKGSNALTVNGGLICTGNLSVGDTTIFKNGWGIVTTPTLLYHIKDSAGIWISIGDTLTFVP